jgi:hypothetical protein
VVLEQFLNPILTTFWFRLENILKNFVEFRPFLHVFPPFTRHDDEMNNSMENSEDPFADIWISNWERQCEIELENEPDLESQVLSERDLATQKLWYLFQNSATAVAQLFKGKVIREIPLNPVTNSGSSVLSRSQPTSSSLVTIPECCGNHYFSLQR